MLALAHFAQEGQVHIVELLGQAFGIGFLAYRPALRCGFHLFDHRAVASRGFDGQLARQQEIAAVAVGDLYHVAAVAKFLHVFFEDHFHERFSVSISPQTAAERYSAPA